MIAPDHKSATISRYEAAVETLFEFDRKEEALNQLVHLTILGIRQVEYHPKLLEAICRGKSAEDPLHQQLSGSKKLSDLARAELSADFSLLHAQAVATLWGTLEAAIRNLVATLVRDVPKVKASPEIGKIKVRLSEFEALDGLERCLYVVDSLEESLGTKRRKGIERFEQLFRALDMSSEISADVCRCLLELYHFRNVIVHRHGKVDRRLLSDCAELELKEGDELQVSHGQYHQYRAAISIYIFTIVNRLRSYFDLTLITHEANCSCTAHSFKYQANLKTHWGGSDCTG